MCSATDRLCLRSALISGVLVTLLVLANATSDGIFPNPNTTPSQYTFTQHIEIDPNAPPSDSRQQLLDNDQDQEGSPVVSSSLMYSGGFLVSSQALMISGGEAFFGGAPFSSSTRIYSPEDEEDEDEDDDEDDEDDDDDGHSAILSKASVVRRSLASANRVPQRSGEQEANNAGEQMIAYREESANVPISSRSCYCSTQRRSQGSALSCNKVLGMRGGAATKLGSELAKRLLVAAIVTLVYEAAIGHLLEFVKIVMQTSPLGTSYVDAMKLITEKGIAGVWDGFVPWGVIQAICKGGVFGLAHAIATSILSPLAENGTLPKQFALTLAGGIAGGFQGFVLSPTLLLKTRVMTNPVFREKMSLLRTTILSFRVGFDVVREEGMMALMKGSGVFATKRVFDWSTRYFYSDLFERLIARQKGEEPLTAMDRIIASLLGGTASTLTTLPLDVLVAKIQDAKKAGVAVSPWALFRDELSERGWSGLRTSYMRGFEARVAHVAFTTACMKIGAPYLYAALFQK